MAAAVDVVSGGEPEIVSPELVLIDPDLAMVARSLLPNPEVAFARLERRRPIHGAQLPVAVPNADRVSTTDEAIGAARRRINALSEVEPPKQRRPRSLSLLRRRHRES